jgi:hypothetical protein
MADKLDFSAKPDDVEAVDWLAPQTKQHEFVLQYLKDRIRFSEQKMSNFHSRWRKNELMLQAYVSLQDFDKIMKDVDSNREAPELAEGPVAINVPFAWATVNTIVTYLLHMFAGRRPIFQVGSYRSEQVNRSKNMEMYLQYNADVVKFIRSLYFFLMDGETYGLAIMRTMWKREIKSRIIQVPPHPDVAMIAQAQGLQPQPQSQSQDYVSFEGNSCTNVDPFMFFPDPRVPMHEVNEKGEWVVWRAYMGRHTLLKEEGLGRLKHVKGVEPMNWNTDNEEGLGSARGMRALGGASSNMRDERNDRISPNMQVDQGSFEIIPSELGLGTSDIPEKWLFTILNKRQIVQAVKLELAHGKHPIVVAEPNSVGYSFGQLGTVDMLGPMQDMMSWFMNSHIYNVRAALNNMLVVDPTKIEMQDLMNPKPGKLIRMKNTAFGLSDPKNAIQQLQVTDVTRSHLADYQMFGRLASDLSGATDNVRGLQDAGGRKTATEIRTSAEAGTSRLAAKGKIYSSMAFTSLAEMWAINAQENLTQEFEMSVLGEQGRMDSFRISPDALQGDFVFPTHDGTLPIDKLAILDVWKEIYMAVIADPQLRASYDILEMFDWIAQLGGAQNIKSFRLNMVPQTQQMQALQGPGGGGVPMDQVMQAMAGAGQQGPAGPPQIQEQ